MNKTEPKRIARAIKEIDQNLNDKHRVDETRLDEKGGHRAFSKERYEY